MVIISMNKKEKNHSNVTKSLAWQFSDGYAMFKLKNLMF